MVVLSEAEVVVSAGSIDSSRRMAGSCVTYCGSVYLRRRRVVLPGVRIRMGRRFSRRKGMDGAVPGSGLVRI